MNLMILIPSIWVSFSIGNPIIKWFSPRSQSIPQPEIKIKQPTPTPSFETLDQKLKRYRLAEEQA